METALEYLIRGQELIPQYGHLQHDCYNISHMVAWKLKREGFDPNIVMITRQKQNGEIVENLIPKNLSTYWKAHYVCILDSKIWDPIFGKPMPVKEYFEKMFGDVFLFEEI